MGKVIAEQSMSLDGFTTGPNVTFDVPMGVRGEGLHDWMFSNDAGAEIRNAPFKTSGAIVIGRRMFDLGVERWGDNPPFHMPVFVITHRAGDRLVKAGGTTYFLVTDGVDDALAQARAAAGDKDVTVLGGANIIQRFMKAGLLDELNLHLVPILLGDGTRLFHEITPEQITLHRTRAFDSVGVTHLTLRVVKA